MSSYDDVEREATHDWLDQREPPYHPDPDDFGEQLAGMDAEDPGPAPQVPVIADSFGVVASVGDLVDQMSSLSPGQADFLVDVAWAEQLIRAVYGPEPAPDPDDTRQEALRRLAEGVNIPQEVMDTAGGNHWAQAQDEYGLTDPEQPCPEDPDGQHFPGCGCSQL